MTEKKKYQVLDTIWRNIEQHDTIVIFRHINPDHDAYGSQFAFAQIIKNNYPNKNVYCYGEWTEQLAFMYQEFADFYEHVPEQITDAYYVTLDTANAERIDYGPLAEVPIDAKIDHHPGYDTYARLEYVHTDTPATCALLLDYFLYRAAQDANFMIATTVYECLYLGIVGDTGNLSYGRGLDRKFFCNLGVIFENIDTKKMLARFYQKSIEEITFRGIAATKIHTDGHFAYMELDSDMIKSYGVSSDYATSLIYLMSELKDVEIWASFFDDKNLGVIRCSLRSRYLDISEVARAFGGGGHMNASGVRVRTWDEVEAIKTALKSLLD